MGITYQLPEPPPERARGAAWEETARAGALAVATVVAFRWRCRVWCTGAVGVLAGASAGAAQVVHVPPEVGTLGATAGAELVVVEEDCVVVVVVPASGLTYWLSPAEPEPPPPEPPPVPLEAPPDPPGAAPPLPPAANAAPAVPSTMARVSRATRSTWAGKRAMGRV